MELHISRQKSVFVSAIAAAVAAAFCTPALGASEVDLLKAQLELQKSALEQQQKVTERLEKEISRLSASQASGTPAPVNNAPGQGVPVISKMQIEVYGGLIPFAESVEATGATTVAPSLRPNQLAPGNYNTTNQERRGRITAGTSHIGFRGSIEATENFRAIWQIEAGAALDGDSAGIGNTNSFGLRNSNVGVSSPYGVAFIGNWDTPYKFISIPTVPLRGATTFDYNVIIGNPGFGVFATTTQSGRVNGKGDAAFDRRQGNSFQYWTPNWNGFSGRIAYSVGETRSAENAIPAINPKLWSVSFGYNNGSLNLQYAHEEHRDYFGMSQIGGGAPSASNRSSRDRGDKIIASYNFAQTGTTLMGMLEQLQYQNDDTGTATNIKQYKRNAYLLSVQQKIGPGKGWFAYGDASDGDCALVGSGSCRTTGLGAKYWNIGYVQSINKLVDLYASMYELDNRESGTYQPVNSVNIAPNSTPTAGLKIRGIGVGAVMLF